MPSLLAAHRRHSRAATGPPPSRRHRRLLVPHRRFPHREGGCAAGEPVNREPDKIEAVGWFALDDPPTPLAIAAREAIVHLSAAE